MMKLITELEKFCSFCQLKLSNEEYIYYKFLTILKQFTLSSTAWFRCQNSFK